MVDGEDAYKQRQQQEAVWLRNPKAAAPAIQHQSQHWGTLNPQHWDDVRTRLNLFFEVDTLFQVMVHKTTFHQIPAGDKKTILDESKQ